MKDERQRVRDWEEVRQCMIYIAAHAQFAQAWAGGSQPTRAR